jgi:enediyne biosynthesis protein E4
MWKLMFFFGVALVVTAASVTAVWWRYYRALETQEVKYPDIQVVKSREEIPDVPKIPFKEETEKAGIKFRHVSGSFGKKLLPETMGSGVVIFDYDGDGYQDILFVNSCYWPGHEEAGQPAPTLALYRNKHDGTFEDVTEAAGLKITLYGMGATAGDYDNDGYIDLFIACVGGNRLFHNISDGLGGRKFEEVKDSGVNGPGGWPTDGGEFAKHSKPINFTSSATWLDYDGDGKLDLFVCNYVEWSPTLDLANPATLQGVGRAFGAPTFFGGTQCFFYRNLGGGKFEDVSEQAGIRVFDDLGKPVAKALGVVACDVDDDGWPDIFVANDTARNFFFHNEPVDKNDPSKGRKFVEMGKKVGIAYAEGSARGAMGIDFAEYRPGYCAYIVGNFANEPDTLLRRDKGRLSFSDVALAEGIYGPSRALLKFGAFFFDYDLDGRLDLLTCNGHLEPEIAKVVEGASYAQPVQLFWNTGSKTRCFEPVTEKQSGEDLFRPMVGRGCAFGDFTNKGRLDVVLTANNGPARLLRNQGETGNHWLRLDLHGDGTHSNRSAIGARVTVEAGGQVYHREVLAGRGYLSQSELPLTFGLGKTAKIDRVTVAWPGRDPGPTTVRENVDADQTLIVHQGKEK